MDANYGLKRHDSGEPDATVAILIVSGSLLVVYSRQIDRGISRAEYFESLEGQILTDVSEKSDLRLNVLNTVEDNVNDSNFSALNDFIGSKIPEAFGYSIQICLLNSTTDYCKMDTPTFIATQGKDIFTEEIMISAELGDGTNAVNNPKKVKLYIWEGQVEVKCMDAPGCTREGIILTCSGDERDVLNRTCRDLDGDECMEARYGVYESCNSSQECYQISIGSDTAMAECVDNKAVLDLRFKDVVYSYVGGYHIYTHTRLFQETWGVGVTLTSSQICYLDGSCDSSPPLNYRIEGYNDLKHINRRFGTTYDSNEFTLKYWGIDDSGFDVYIEEKMCVDGTSSSTTSFGVSC